MASFVLRTGDAGTGVPEGTEMDEHVAHDEALVEQVAHAGGSHDADWATMLTEQERQRYRWDARAAIEAVRTYNAQQSMDRHTDEER